MSASIRLSFPVRPDLLLTLLRGSAARLRGAWQAWKVRQRAAHDTAVLRAMSDRELADLALGRGETARDAGPAGRRSPTAG